MSTNTNSSFRFDLNPTAKNNINVPQVGGMEQLLPSKEKMAKLMGKKSKSFAQAYADRDMDIYGDLSLEDYTAEAKRQLGVKEETGSWDAPTQKMVPGDDQGPTDDTVEEALSRRELRQQARRNRKASRIENLQRKRKNLSEAGDAKYNRLLDREHRMAKRQQNVGEGARKFRDRRDKVMNSMRDSKVGRFFKGNTSS